MEKRGNVLVFKIQKWGVSPLIATIMIIGLVFLVSIVVVLWAGDFEKTLQASPESKTADQYTCLGAVISLEEVRQTKPNTLEFLATNIGNKDIDSILIRISGSKGSINLDRPGLSLTEEKLFVIEFDPEKVGTIWEVNTLPAIKTGRVITHCAPGTIRNL